MKTYIIVALILLLTAMAGYGDDSAPSSDAAGTISGRVLIKGKKAMTNGAVLIFDINSGPHPSRDEYWRIPDIISSTDDKGRFSVTVAPGTYYLQVAQKDPNGDIGPPKKYSEFFYFHGDTHGNPYALNVKPGVKIDLGTLKAYEFTPQMERHGAGVTSVEGLITDLEGNPIENVYVFAYISDNPVGRPTFVSDKSDKNGKYVLRLHEGTYHLKVRSVIGGGPPHAGELQNVTKDFDPVSVTVEKGQHLSGIALKAGKFAGKNSGGTIQPDNKWKKIGDRKPQS